jgi:hypothetical protein
MREQNLPVDRKKFVTYKEKIMNLAKYLHLHWATSEELDSLLPAENFFTGASGRFTRPYAVLSKESEKPFTRHNDGSAIVNVVMRFRLFHDEYDAGLDVIEAVERTFEGVSLELDEGRTLFAMRRIAASEIPLDDGAWQFTVDFLCIVYLPEGM